MRGPGPRLRSPAALRSAFVVLLILASSLGQPASADAARQTGRSVEAGPRDHVILGAVAQTRQEAEERERETGHRLTGLRVFRRWDQPLFDADQQWAARTGHAVFVSVKARRADGSAVGWRDIATAPPGSPLANDMLRQAGEIKRFGALVYVVFNHEPDAAASQGMGGPGDFIAAWRRVVTTYRSAGVRNARYVWTMTDWAFGRNAGAYYPGDAYVDDIAADTYNWYGCRGGNAVWRSLADLIEPQRRFGLAHPGKGLMLLEFGTVEDPARPGRKAQWLTDAARLFTQPAYRQYRAILYWDDRHTGVMAGTNCNFDYRTSAGALAAWRAMAAAPVFATAPPCTRGHCRAGRRHLGRVAAIGVGAFAAALVAVGVVAFIGLRRRRRRTSPEVAELMRSNR